MVFGLMKGKPTARNCDYVMLCGWLLFLDFYLLIWKHPIAPPYGMKANGIYPNRNFNHRRTE